MIKPKVGDVIRYLPSGDEYVVNAVNKVARRRYIFTLTSM